MPKPKAEEQVPKAHVTGYAKIGVALIATGLGFKEFREGRHAMVEVDIGRITPMVKGMTKPMTESLFNRLTQAVRDWEAENMGEEVTHGHEG